MTKEITKARILQELENKFKLREFEKDSFLFSETVVPIYNIDPHLVRYRGDSNTVSITSAAAFEFFKVPEDEIWTLRGYNVIFMTGTYTIAGVYHKRPTTAYHYLDLTAAQNVSYAVNLSAPAILDSGDSIWINVDGYTITGNLMMRIDYKEEKIR